MAGGASAVGTVIYQAVLGLRVQPACRPFEPILTARQSAGADFEPASLALPASQLAGSSSMGHLGDCPGQEKTYRSHRCRGRRPAVEDENLLPRVWPIGL